MTPISRRDVLAGLAAAGAASVVSARGEQRQSSAASNAALLSVEERRQHADALLRYFAANAPQLLRAPDGILKHPSVAQSLPGKTYSTQLWDWDTLWTSQGLFRLAALATRRVAQAKALRARLRKPLELSRSRLTGWANSDHDDRRRSRHISGSGQKRDLKKSGQACLRSTRAARLRSARRCELVGATFRFDSAFLRFLDEGTTPPRLACWCGATMLQSAMTMTQPHLAGLSFPRRTCFSIACSIRIS